VRGIAVSSQGISFVLLDEAGRPLGNAINWLDGRATAECDDILACYRGEALFALTGKRAAPFYVLPKLLWLRRHEPQKWQAARRLLMGHDYLVYRLCGAHVTDHSLAGGTLLYDLVGLDWSGERLDAFDHTGDLRRYRRGADRSLHNGHGRPPVRLAFAQHDLPALRQPQQPSRN
jgi:xylulokinase